MRISIALLLTLLAANLCTLGCSSAAGSPPTEETQRTTARATLRSTLGRSAMESAQFAAFVRDFVERSMVAPSEKPMMIARASVLEHHARDLLDNLGSDDSLPLQRADLEIATLNARIAAIRAERTTLEYEWNVWQVAHGVKRAEDTELHLVMPDGDC